MCRPDSPDPQRQSRDARDRLAALPSSWLLAALGLSADGRDRRRARGEVQGGYFGMTASRVGGRRLRLLGRAHLGRSRPLHLRPGGLRRGGGADVLEGRRARLRGRPRRPGGPAGASSLDADHAGLRHRRVSPPRREDDRPLRRPRRQPHLLPRGEPVVAELVYDESQHQGRLPRRGRGRGRAGSLPLRRRGWAGPRCPTPSASAASPRCTARTTSGAGASSARSSSPSGAEEGPGRPDRTGTSDPGTRRARRQRFHLR